MDRIQPPRVQKKKVRYRNFTWNTDLHESALTEDYAREIVNLTGKNGALCNAFGVKDCAKIGVCSLNGTQGKVAYYRRYDSRLKKRDDKLVFYLGSEQPLYYMNLYGTDVTLQELNCLPFQSVPNFINYRLDGEDVLIITGEQDSMTVWNGEDRMETITDAPKINSMCLHYERLFATDAEEGTSLWFSDDLDPRNWSVSLDEAGFIEIVDDKGKLLKVVSYLDYVYIFRSYGISRLSAFGDQTQFAVHELFQSMGRIFPESVCICGNVILFLCRDGLYQFDGVSVSRLSLGLDVFLQQCNYQNLCACYYEGKYYIACHNPAWQGVFNNCVLRYDKATKNVELIAGIDVCDFEVQNADNDSTLLVMVRMQDSIRLGEICNDSRCFEQSLQQTYTTPTTDFGAPGQEKCIRLLRLTTDAPLKLTILCDGQPHVYAVNDSQLPQVIAINLPCIRCQLKIDVNQAVANVSSLQLEAEVIL